MAEDRDKQSMGVKTPLNSPYNVTYGNTGTGIIRGNGSDWFGPLNPLFPTAPADVKGRILDFQAGYNLNQKPKRESTNGRNENVVTFEMLRSFADAYDLLRLVIETRKDQMSRLKWNISVREGVKRDKNEYEDRIAEIRKFFLRPDKVNFWGDWIRLLLEDLLVLDAPAAHIRRTYGGDLYSIEPLDGGTIKRVIDNWGRTPIPPTAAYQQVLAGYPAIDYTTEELIYRPRNKRTHRVYGFGPVEQIIMTINIALRRQTWQLETFTEGNMPEALIGTPTTWTPDQIASFQNWFDSMLQGNTAERSRAKFVPGEVGKSFIEPNRGELFGQAEEWLARVVCFAFSISPQPFLKMMNRATAETAQETAVADGLAPMMGWVKSLMDGIIIDLWGEEDLEFVFNDEDELDPKTKSEILDRDASAGYITINQSRKDRGMDPYPEPEFDRPMLKTASGWVPIVLTPEEKAAKEAAAAAMRESMGIEDPEDGGDDSGNGGEDPDEVPPGGGGSSGGPKPPSTTIPPSGAEVAKSDMPGELSKSGDEVAHGSPNPEREFVSEREKAIKALIQVTLKRLGKKVSEQTKSFLNEKLEKSDFNKLLEELMEILDLSVLSNAEDYLSDFLSEIYNDSSRVALAMLGQDSEGLVEQVYDRAVKWAKEKAADLVGRGDGPFSLADSTRKMVRGIISSGLENNLSTDDIAEELMNSHPFSEERAELIAYTEVTKANSEGALDGYKEARSIGIKMGKSWLMLEDACSVCSENAEAGIIDLDEKFPSGDDAPGAHPKCRCVLIPEVYDDQGGDVEKLDTLEKKYNQDQPRAPKGQDNGGQFISVGGSEPFDQSDSIEAGEPVPAPPLKNVLELSNDDIDAALKYREYDVATSENSKLRSGGKLELEMQKGLGNAALAHRFTEDTALYRGATGKSLDQWEKLVGKTVNLGGGGYISTSTSANVAWNYAGHSGNVMRIIAPKGKTGFSFAKISSDPEGEFLIRPKQRMKVLSVDRTEGIINMEWV